jgi:acetyl-CoA carboxylase biotin carboxyl carrier protein
MDLKQIQELIKIVTKSGIAELKVKEGEYSISITNFHAANSVVQVPNQNISHTTGNVNAETSKTESKPAPTTEAQASNLRTFKSPMIGTFYRKPGAEKDPFVKVGDTVKAGDVLCIVEAMKLFNEIEFDGGTGKIVKILVDDASPVEYDQPLFLIETI